jgi:predicted HTH transcriptional regulator
MLPSLPENLESIEYFPFPEGKHFEYKQSHKSVDKLLNTICAYLNSEGGHIIFGVLDRTLEVIGMDINYKECDNWVLNNIDGIFHYQRIIYKETNLGIDSKYIKSEIVKRNNGKYIIVITVKPCDEQVQIHNGVIYYRLNASNMKLRTQKIYIEEQMTALLYNQRKVIEKDYKYAISSFSTEIKKQSSLIKRLEKNVDEVKDILYKRILEEKAQAEEFIEIQRSPYWLSCLGF